MTVCHVYMTYDVFLWFLYTILSSMEKLSASFMKEIDVDG